MTTRRVTKRDAEAVLRTVRKRFEPWLKDENGKPYTNGDQPMLVMDFDWFGYGAVPTIVWEGGPYEWALLDSGGDVEEEFGFRVAPLTIPAAVYTEPTTGWALGIYRR